MSQNLPKWSLQDFLSLCHPNHLVNNLRAQTIETSSLSTDSSQPLFKQIEIFSGILSLIYTQVTY